MSLRRNVVANYLGQAWVAAMGLAFIPLYIRYLGIEAYGVMGLFALIQAWLALLDMGMTPTIGREMARFAAGDHNAQSIRNLLRSMEWLAFGLAAVICLAVWAASGRLAADWLKPEALSPTVVRDAIAVMAWVIGLRLVESIYRSALFGLQRQVWYNVVNAAIATLRGLGAVAVLALWSPTLSAFFAWQALISLLSVLVLALGVNRALPRPPAPPRASWATLHSVWRFAGGMTGITFTAVLLTQVDKVLLSRMLTLQDFGYYALAAMVAGSLYLMVSPITTALFPRLVESVTQKDEVALARSYHQGAQLVSVATAPVALLLVFHGEGVLYAWSADPALALTSGPILSALAFGTLLNCLMYMPYQAQLAHGWTSLTLKINLAAVALLVPALFWVVPHYGALGAAWVWIVLNSGYLLVNVGLMHRRILAQEKWRWYGRDVALPGLAATAALTLLHGMAPAGRLDRLSWIAYLSIVLLLALAASAFSLRELRTRMLVSLRATVNP
jgi:O-antigen/teichoic acid export membrane protein